MLRVGVSLRSRYPGVDPRTGAKWMIERARAAADAGLQSLFVGDHHAVTEPYFQNTPIIGRLLAEWDERPAGALYLLPLWHPLLVAEQTATLAAIHRGPFVMQCAIGADERQFDAMGVRLRDRVPLFETWLDTIRRLWTGEEVTLDRYGMRAARVGLLPPEPISVWIGGHAPAAIDRAARLGDAWLAGPETTFEVARDLLTSYRERCAAHSREPQVVAIRRDVHVGADDDDARRVAEPVLARGYRGFDPSALVIGGPEHVAGRLRELGEMGFTDVLVRHLADEQDEVLASMERLGRVRELPR